MKKVELESTSITLFVQFFLSIFDLAEPFLTDYFVFFIFIFFLFDFAFVFVFICSSDEFLVSRNYFLPVFS